MSSRFASEPSVEALAREQGVDLAPDFDLLLGDFWPEDESADDFNAAVERWRSEDADREITAHPEQSE